jgi:predicted nuclease of predicted toxin-antitoxin system
VKLLLDSCVWGGAKAVLLEAGHDVVWCGDWVQDPGDTQILAIAYQDGRVLVTIDKDFGDLAVHQGQPHRGIIRIVDFAARQQATVCQVVLERYAADVTAGSIITAERGRVRIRRNE